MKLILLIALANTLPNPHKIDTKLVAEDIVSVTTNDTEQRVLLAWGYFESMWGKFNLGDCQCDGKNHCPNLSDRHTWNCKSFGVMQTQNPEKWGAAKEKIILDRKLGFRIGLAIFRYWMKATNGDVHKSLRLYSSGSSTKAIEKVEKRCKLVGL